MAEVLVPKDASALESIKSDDVVISFRVPRDMTKRTVSPKIPSSISAFSKAASISYDVESDSKTMMASARECVVSMVVAKSKAAAVRSAIDGLPDVEAQRITAAKEAEVKSRFSRFVVSKKAAEDCRRQEEVV